MEAIPRYKAHLDNTGDPVAGIALTKLSATGGVGASELDKGARLVPDSSSGTGQPPPSDIMSGKGPKGEDPLLDDPQALARRQARENATRNNTYGEFDPSSGGTKALTSSPDPESLRMKNSRPLTEAEKQMLRARNSIAGTVDLDQIRVHDNDTDTPFFMPNQVPGMTMENHIYLPTIRDEDGNPMRYDFSNQRSKDLLAHEVQHVQQFQNGMTRAGYLWDAGTNGYDKSKYEEEAVRAQK